MSYFVLVPQALHACWHSAITTPPSPKGDDALNALFVYVVQVLEYLLCAEQCNSFGLWRSRPPRLGSLVGFGIFPSMCMLNHNCLPNVTVMQEQRPPKAVLRAYTISPVQEGEELCISYSEVLPPPLRRT